MTMVAPLRRLGLQHLRTSNLTLQGSFGEALLQLHGDHLVPFQRTVSSEEVEDVASYLWNDGDTLGAIIRPHGPTGRRLPLYLAATVDQQEISAFILAVAKRVASDPRMQAVLSEHLQAVCRQSLYLTPRGVSHAEEPQRPETELPPEEHNRNAAGLTDLRADAQPVELEGEAEEDEWVNVQKDYPDVPSAMKKRVLPKGPSMRQALEEVGAGEWRELRAAYLCTICNDVTMDAECLPCGHTFCAPCIHQLLEELFYKPNCPNCRKPFTAGQCNPVINLDQIIQERVAQITPCSDREAWLKRQSDWRKVNAQRQKRASAAAVEEDARSDLRPEPTLEVSPREFREKCSEAWDNIIGALRGPIVRQIIAVAMVLFATAAARQPV